jgi:hypothetical protein
MAKCRGCAKEVGCACNLTNGLCIACINNGVKRFIKWVHFL